MGTTAVSYKDKYFWMHDAVGEVFSAILLDELRKNPNIMIDLRNEIETILPHWVVGILISFKDYLDNPDNIPIFIRAIDSSIKLTQGLKRDLNVLEYSVDRDTFFLRKFLHLNSLLQNMIILTNMLKFILFILKIG